MNRLNLIATAVLFGALFSIANSQTVYMTSPGMQGETSTGIHAFETPIDAIETRKSWNGSEYSYIFVLRKHLNKSSVGLMKRWDSDQLADYSFNYYNKNDSKYYSVVTTKGEVTGYEIVAPECNTTPNCGTHYEEMTIRVCIQSTRCDGDVGSVKFTNHDTGESFTDTE